MSTIFILSLGQITESKVSRSVNAFARLLNYSRYYVYFAYLKDRVLHHTIEQYKTNLLTEDEFKEKLKYQLSAQNLSDEDFLNAWVEMDRIGQEQLDLIRKINKYADESDNKIVIVSNTDRIHFDFINKTMAENNIRWSEKIAIVTAMDVHSLDYDVMKWAGLQKVNYDIRNDRIISLHKSIRIPNYDFFGNSNSYDFMKFCEFTQNNFDGARPLTVQSISPKFKLFKINGSLRQYDNVFETAINKAKPIPDCSECGMMIYNMMLVHGYINIALLCTLAAVIATPDKNGEPNFYAAAPTFIVIFGSAIYSARKILNTKEREDGRPAKYSTCAKYSSFFILSLIPMIILGSIAAAAHEEYELQATAPDMAARQRLVKEALEMIETLHQETSPTISR